MDIGSVLVTGAGGFIGGRLTQALRGDGIRVVGMRRPLGAGRKGIERHGIERHGIERGGVEHDGGGRDDGGRDHGGRDDGARGGVEEVFADLLDCEGLARACAGIDTVVHCAGHAHAFGAPVGAAQRLHHEINFVGTRNLAEAAGSAGVRRLVFLSSVKAMGAPGADCVDESWTAAPESAYGIAKRKAEDAVLAAGQRYGMGATNLRLAMVYGRGGRGNLERMARAIRAGWFPPLPETGGKRSLVHVADVVAALRCVLADGRANGKTWIVADAQAWSGAEIYDALRALMGRRPPVWRVPAGLLRAAGRAGDGFSHLLGRPLALDSEAVARLLGPECYRPDAIRRAIGWQSRVTLYDGLREMLGPDPLAGQGDGKRT